MFLLEEARKKVCKRFGVD